MSTGWWRDREGRKDPHLESNCDRPGKGSKGSQGDEIDMKSIAQAHAFILEKGIPPSKTDERNKHT